MSKHNALTTFGQSGNPMFRGEAFKPDATFAQADSPGRMTLAGTVNKTGILLILCLITAAYTWNIFFQTGWKIIASSWAMLILTLQQNPRT